VSEATNLTSAYKRTPRLPPEQEKATKRTGVSSTPPTVGRSRPVSGNGGASLPPSSTLQIPFQNGRVPLKRWNQSWLLCQPCIDKYHPPSYSKRGNYSKFPCSSLYVCISVMDNLSMIVAYPSLCRGAHLIMSSTRRIISAASVADNNICFFTCTAPTYGLKCPISYSWLSNRDQMSYSACRIGQLYPIGFS
jgi:hypothetical protein